MASSFTLRTSVTSPQPSVVYGGPPDSPAGPPSCSIHVIIETKVLNGPLNCSHAIARWMTDENRSRFDALAAI